MLLPFSMKAKKDKLILIGASTGGSAALQIFLQRMPSNCPGIVIVQHMPEIFTYSFANRMNELCNIIVREGVNGEPITPGKAIIAPGDKHLMIRRASERYFVEINRGPSVNHYRPSVDVLFSSAAEFAGPDVLGIILTGMGNDGAKGLLQMKNSGSITIAQDEGSSFVFDMPKAAIAIGAAKIVLPLDQIAGYACQWARN